MIKGVRKFKRLPLDMNCGMGQNSHVSRLTSHVSRLTSHVSRLTSHVSRLTSHVSRRGVICPYINFKYTRSIPFAEESGFFVF